MSRLLARIMLALLMLPLGGIVFALVMAMLHELFRIRNEELGFFLSIVATGIFVVVYWILLWHSTVRWEKTRVTLTIAAGAAALVVGVIVGAMVVFVEESFAIFVGGLLTILLWLALTTIVWQETARERTARIRMHDAHAIACPVCGYNMTGLTQSICPECGSRFTISELVAAQAGADADELEGDTGDGTTAGPIQ